MTRTPAIALSCVSIVLVWIAGGGAFAESVQDDQDMSMVFFTPTTDHLDSDRLDKGKLIYPDRFLYSEKQLDENTMSVAFRLPHESAIVSDVLRDRADWASFVDGYEESTVLSTRQAEDGSPIVTVEETVALLGARDPVKISVEYEDLFPEWARISYLSGDLERLEGHFFALPKADGEVRYTLLIYELTVDAGERASPRKTKRELKKSMSKILTSIAAEVQRRAESEPRSGVEQ